MNKYKVLVVEDDQDLIKGLSVRLRHFGYDVVQAVDGYQAVSVALKEQPDAVLLDIGLPAGSGISVLSRYAALPTLMCTPVVVLTGRDPYETDAAVRPYGVVALLHKPADNEALEAALYAAVHGEPYLPKADADADGLGEVTPTSTLAPRAELA